MDIFKAILSLQPDAKFSLTGNEYENLIWFDENELPPPSKEEVLEAAQRIQQEYKNNQYQRDRALEYPDFKEYLDGVVKGDQAQIQAYIDKCLEVKEKYPKPE